MTWDEFWHVYWTGFLWLSAVSCTAVGFREWLLNRRAGNSIVPITVAVLAAMEALSR